MESFQSPTQLLMLATIDINIINIGVAFVLLQNAPTYLIWSLSNCCPLILINWNTCFITKEYALNPNPLSTLGVARRPCILKQRTISEMSGDSGFYDCHNLLCRPSCHLFTIRAAWKLCVFIVDMRTDFWEDDSNSFGLYSSLKTHFLYHPIVQLNGHMGNWWQLGWYCLWIPLLKFVKKSHLIAEVKFNAFQQQNAMLSIRHNWWNDTDHAPCYLLSAGGPVMSRFQVNRNATLPQKWSPPVLVREACAELFVKTRLMRFHCVSTETNNRKEISKALTLYIRRWLLKCESVGNLSGAQMSLEWIFW